AGLKAAQALARARELQRGRVVQHEDLAVVRAPLGSHDGRRPQDSREAHRVVGEEPVARLELSLRGHRLREAPGRTAAPPLADALQPRTPPSIAERRAPKLACDLHEHRAYRS